MDTNIEKEETLLNKNPSDYDYGDIKNILKSKLKENKALSSIFCLLVANFLLFLAIGIIWIAYNNDLLWLGILFVVFNFVINIIVFREEEEEEAEYCGYDRRVISFEKCAKVGNCRGYCQQGDSSLCRWIRRK
jgi:hypothetical protein